MLQTSQLNTPVLTCHFWNVGQGLFSSGKIETNNGEPFVWVYDCGTASSQILIDNAILEMQKEYQLDRIDLLVTSHFDKDHISGVKSLLKRYPVRYWLLPYYSKWKRYVIAIEKGISVHSSLFTFYQDPFAFIQKEFKEYIKETKVIFYDSLESNDANELNNVQFEQLDGNLEPLEKGGYKLNKNITYKGFEFIPYNLPISLVSTNGINFYQFELDIEYILNNSPTTKSLQLCYDKYFGKSSKQRNIISLFLYIGVAFNSYSYKQNYFSNQNKVTYSVHISDPFITSILYTGDGYLDTKQRVNDLSHYLGSRRMNNIYCFQVPHHGAKNNWHKGLAKEISPTYSVFSSDPNHKKYGHPHAMVSQDFLPYSPIQVDKVNKFKFKFIF
ncbi:MBL fold metallo-hydrolase [Glaesserella parasuis]|uniref:MBL fold metallo-hydrolase n=1 Tax=Glaesserella parasuis TaxID=738 RepID=UPI002436B13B|nr:MBL fold metallo-hydrolase [Glaesserella parasuis]MDG6474871.1 MBL fold metallo-hydrolase [Glaesserella parasuis]